MKARSQLSLVDPYHLSPHALIQDTLYRTIFRHGESQIWLKLYRKNYGFIFESRACCNGFLFNQIHQLLAFSAWWRIVGIV